MLKRCDEHVIAGSPDDFMEVRHLMIAGDDRAIGAHLAKLARERHGCREESWARRDNEHAQRIWLEQNWPAQAERARGVAETLGLDDCIDEAPDGVLDASLLYYQWAVPGCSVAFYPPAHCADGHATLARNYDFTTGSARELLHGDSDSSQPPATSRPYLMEVHPDRAYATLTVCAYELLAGATDGVNSEGLGVALLADTETLSTAYRPRRDGVGICEIQLVRWLLETCRDVKDAREALLATPQFYLDVPCHYMVADRSGDSFVWELGFSKRPGLVRGEAMPWSVTNHLLCQTEHRADMEESIGRKARLDARVHATPSPRTRAEIDAANRAVAAVGEAGQGQYAGASLARTLWHAFYDLEALSLSIDFYLGEGSDGAVRRSPQSRLSLTPQLGRTPQGSSEGPATRFE